MLWSLLLLATTLQAADIPDCAHVPGEHAKDQPALADVLSCQDATRRVWKALDPRPSGADWDRLDESQRAEVRAYVKRHPSAPQGEAKPDAPAALGGLTDADRKQVDPQTAEALQLLEASLQGASDGGRKGIDPGMAKQIEGFLNQQQGGLSPDMKALLGAVEKDGPNLSADTMAKLQEAAGAAKGAGLDLNIKPDVEKHLLDDEVKPAPDPAPPEDSPGSPAAF